MSPYWSSKMIENIIKKMGIPALAIGLTGIAYLGGDSPKDTPKPTEYVQIGPKLPSKKYAILFRESTKTNNRTIQKSKSQKHDFSKDSEKVLLARMLFGEARGYNVSETVAIGFTAINRANDGFKYNGEGLKSALLAPSQYSCFNKWDKNFPKILNPKKYDDKAWERCLKISEKILNGKYDKHNYEQTHYHVKNMKKKGKPFTPVWAKKMKERLNSKGLKHQFYRGV